MNINLHHLELFYYVAEAQGISQAIKVIPYSIQQPAISQQMISLEKSLGVKLFDRRPFKLHEAGRILLETVAPFMEKLATLEDDLKGFSRQYLKIACPAIYADYYLPEILKTLMEKCSDVLPQVYELEGMNPHRQLLSNDVDVVITSEPTPRSKKIYSETLISLPHVIVLKKDHPLAQNFEWSEQAFRSIRWVTFNQNSDSQQALIQALREFEITPISAASTSSMITALRYVSMDMGLGFMVNPPKFLLEEFNLTTIPLQQVPQADITISFPEDIKDQEEIQELLQLCKDKAKERKKDFQ